MPPSRVNPQFPISNLGVDSLMSIELQYSIETSLGVGVPMASFLQGDSLVTLASQILSQLDAQAPSARETARGVEEDAGGQAAETYPLSYGQRALWFLYHLAPESTAYNIARAAATLPPPATTCADYVGRQAELLSGTEGERLWEYWREQLAGQPPALDLLTDRPRPVVQTYNGSSRGVLLSKQLTEALKGLGRAQGATLYMTLRPSRRYCRRGCGRRRRR